MKTYKKQQKEKILDFAREMRDSWEISQEKFLEVYFYNFIKKLRSNIVRLPGRNE